MSDPCRLRVALLGEGAVAERWAAAIRDLAQLRPWPEQLSGDLDAAVLAPGAGDPFARAKQALQAGLPVLYAAPFLLSPWQVAVLAELSQHGGRLLRFVEPFHYRPGFGFLRRVLQGREPFWRPLYLRTLCLARPDGPARIDELAMEELAVCDALLDDTPRHVTAIPSWRDEAGDVCAAFLMLHYSGGPLAQCTISLAEANTARQLVAVTASRTVILDELDPDAPVRIVSGGEQQLCAHALGEAASPQGGADRALTWPGPDAVAEEMGRFLTAVATGDLALANGDRWTRVATLWWAARQSMSFGGSTQALPPAPLPGDTKPPPLRVIEGGGRTARTAWRRPSLTVVAR